MDRVTPRPTSRDALLKRICRALRRWDWHLEILRGEQAALDAGRYRLVDAHGNIKDRDSNAAALPRDQLVLCAARRWMEARRAMKPWTAP